MSSIKYVGELRNYFNRKLQQDKNKMSIITQLEISLLYVPYSNKQQQTFRGKYVQSSLKIYLKLYLFIP